MRSTEDTGTAGRSAWNLRFLRQPAIGFGFALIAGIWIATWHFIKIERQSFQRSAETEAATIATLFEQNIIRTASELDRILKYMRSTYERNGYRADWPGLIREVYTIDNEAVQIAVIQRDGMMLTSTAMLYPPKTVDLSDREHFLAQQSATEDKLYISKPMKGRASGKWSVQFARRLTDEKGEFAGVLVISLDPGYLTRAYSSLDLGINGGLALVGQGGVVRAGTGAFADAVGREFDYFEKAGSLFESDASKSVEQSGGDGAIVSVRDVPGYPLRAVVVDRGVEVREDWQLRRRNYLLGAAAASLMAFALMTAVSVRRHRYEMEILHNARHDALTGLKNRLSLREEAERLLARPLGERGFALQLLDLDGFKQVNDTHGHATGDRVLAAVASRLRAAARKSDFVVRLCGDEFAILHRVEDFEHDAQGFALRLCQTMSAPFTVDGMDIAIGASIGIVSGECANAVNDLLCAADLAAREVKANRRGTFAFYQDEMAAAVRSRRSIESSLRTALKSEQFELHYQPIKSVRDGKTTSYEALLRWRHPERGLVPPAEFIPLAEQTGLIVPIGAWVLQKACADIAARAGDFRVAINFSAIQFRSPDLVENVRKALSQTGLKPSRLEIEITESALIDDGARVASQLHELRALGVHISLDDFGTGYSCLSYLELYPIDSIKIDRSFVMKLDENRATWTVVRAIIDLASSFGMNTIAEGVETVEQLRALSELGCSEVQGYLFSRPKPIDDIIEKSAPRASLTVVAA